MSLKKILIPRLSLLFIVCALLSWPAYSQDDNSNSSSQTQDQGNQSQDHGNVEGTVVASSHTTFVVRSDDNHFHVFTFDNDTTRPRTLAVGARVRVNSDEGDQEGARRATDVTVVDRAQGAGSANAAARDAAPVPPSVRHVENQIKRDARRWRLGARAGVGLDPELVLFGVHSQIGPVFNRNVFFRPNADFEWGEVTDMVALNLEAVYRFRSTTRGGAWAPYVGAGPSLNFIHQSFDTQAGQSRNISFGNFDYETGFNVLMGLENRHGTFFEVKTSLYSQPAPVLRLMVGKTF